MSVVNHNAFLFKAHKDHRFGRKNLTHSPTVTLRQEVIGEYMCLRVRGTTPLAILEQPETPIQTDSQASLAQPTPKVPQEVAECHTQGLRPPTFISLLLDPAVSRLEPIQLHRYQGSGHRPRGESASLQGLIPYSQLSESLSGPRHLDLTDG